MLGAAHMTLVTVTVTVTHKSVEEMSGRSRGIGQRKTMIVDYRQTHIELLILHILCINIQICIFIYIVFYLFIFFIIYLYIFIYMFHDYRMISPRYAEKMAITLAFPWRLGATRLFRGRTGRFPQGGRRGSMGSTVTPWQGHGIYLGFIDVHGFVYPFYLLIYGFVCMNMIEYDWIWLNMMINIYMWCYDFMDILFRSHSI